MSFGDSQMQGVNAPRKSAVLLRCTVCKLERGAAPDEVNLVAHGEVPAMCGRLVRHRELGKPGKAPMAAKAGDART